MCVHPRTQIVSPMVFCVTAGLIAPGVVDASGSELCARAPLADRVTNIKIATAPNCIAACPVIAGAIVPSASAKRISLAPACGGGGRGIRPAAARVARITSLSSLAALRGQGSARKGGTCDGAETLVDVDHRQIFPKNGFRIGAPEVRTRGPTPSSSASRSAEAAVPSPRERPPRAVDTFSIAAPTLVLPDPVALRAAP
jgi:hypothetical protein